MAVLRLINLGLLILFPVSWGAPLMKAGLLPFFKLTEISILSGIEALLEKDPFIAWVVILFALIAPIGKTLALFAVQMKWIGKRALPLLDIASKLSMTDVFLVAIYIVAAKGIGVGRIEIGWGLYLFTGCVLTSMLVTHLTKTRLKR